MPFSLELPAKFKRAGWKVKIREKETREPPHVTIIRRADSWRINLRTGEFMDRDPSPADVPRELDDYVRTQMRTLREKWNEKYPTNPV